MLVPYLFPSTKPAGRAASTTPHSGAFGQASVGMPVRRTISLGGTTSNVPCSSRLYQSTKPS